MKKITIAVILVLLCSEQAVIAQTDFTGMYGNKTLDPKLLAQPGRDAVEACRNRVPSNPPTTYDNNCDAMVSIYDRNAARASAAAPNRSFDSPPQIDPGFVSATDSIANTYTGCKDETQTTQQQITDTQTCTDSYGVSQGNTCSKTLSVTVTYNATCSPTATRVVQVTAGPPPTYRCEYDTTNYSCNPGDTLSGTTCTPPAPGVPYAATPTVTTTTSVATVTPIETDTWADGCAALEARVPSGFLPPDGNNTIPGGVPTSGGADKCLRTSSLCTDLDTGPRLINGDEVTRACWAWSDQFTCIEPAPTTCDSDNGPVPNPNPGQPCSNCPQLLNAMSCTENGGSPACRPDGMDASTGLCAVYEHSYNCVEQAAQTNTVTNCGSQKYCTGGVCYDAGYPPDADFAKSVTGLEAARESGRYMDHTDINNMHVFGGVDSRCVRKLGGLINCCKSGGFAELVSDLKAGADKLKELGEDAQKPSDYVGDSLFSNVAPSWVRDGLGIIGIRIYSPTDVFNFLNSLGTFAWDLAMKVISLFGLFDCADENKITVMRKSQGLCHYVGDYCSDSFLGICFARRETYCCYNSKLARIINEQARDGNPPTYPTPQLAKGWGGSQSPDCSGFTPQQLSSLNFDQMDLSEFYSSISSAGGPVKTSAPPSNVTATMPNCAANGGPCQTSTAGAPPPAPPYTVPPYDPSTDPACKYSAPGYTRPARCG